MRKFGRKPARHTRKTFRSGLVLAYHLNQLGPPPPKSHDWTSAVDYDTHGDWGMMGNDQYGCCVEADEGHSMMLRTANVGHIVIPSTQDVLALYSAETGFKPGDSSTDQGTDETQACQYMVDTGFLGHKARAVAAVDPLNFDHVKWAIQLFGSLRTGFNVPNYAMDQAGSGKPWDLDPSGDQTVDGGHDVPFVKYDEKYFYCVTWGKLQAVTPAFVKSWFDEAHALLFDDWMDQGGLSPSKLATGQLLADLDEVSQS